VKKIVFKKYIRYLFLVPSFVLVLFLSPCMDFGILEDQETFYSSFDDIIAKYDSDNEIANYEVDIERIFNESTVNEFKWEDEDDEVEYHQYVYIVIPFTRTMKITSLALCVAGVKEELENQEIIMEVSAFYFPDEDSCPSDDNFKLLSSPDGTSDDYEDPDINTKVASASYQLTSEWSDGIYFESFSNSPYVIDKCLNVSDGGYLYIRIENNSGLNKGKMTPCTFSFMNLLVRAE